MKHTSARVVYEHLFAFGSNFPEIFRTGWDAIFNEFPIMVIFLWLMFWFTLRVCFTFGVLLHLNNGLHTFCLYFEGSCSGEMHATPNVIYYGFRIFVKGFPQLRQKRDPVTPITDRVKNVVD